MFYRNGKSRATMAGESLGNAIVEMANLMYQENTKKSFYNALLPILNKEGIVIDQTTGDIIYKFRSGTDVIRSIMIVNMTGEKRRFIVTINDEKGITDCKPELEG